MTEPGARPLAPRNLREAVARGPLVLDAALGARLIALGLDPSRDDPALWTIDRPDAVLDLHVRDVLAGSDALLTNTFGANRHWLARFGRAADSAAINRRATALAREAAGPGRFVIGSIGPTACDDPDALVRQVEALADSGVDALLFETHRGEQAERALGIVGQGVSGTLPRLVSLVEWPGSGPAGLARRLEDLGACVLGVNCVSGMGPALKAVRAIAGLTWLPLLVKPSAGLPGGPKASPASFAAAVPALLACGVRLIGGCCGTTEEHVAALRAACYDASRTGRTAGETGA